MPSFEQYTAKMGDAKLFARAVAVAGKGAS
jgi:hypothetical protein